MHRWSTLQDPKRNHEFHSMSLWAHFDPFSGYPQKKPNRRYTMLYPHEFLWYPHVVKNIPISYRQLVIPKCLFPRYIPITLWQSSIAKGNFRYMEVYSWEHHRTKLNGWFSSKLRLIAGVYSPMFLFPWYSHDIRYSMSQDWCLLSGIPTRVVSASPAAKLCTVRA